MGAEKDLEKYIKECISKGFNEKEIKEKIINTGYDKDMTDTIFDGLRNKWWFKKAYKKSIKEKQDEIIKKRIELAKKEEQEQEKQDETIKEKPKGLNQKIEDINEKLNIITTKKKKGQKEEDYFKLPYNVRRQLKTLNKRDKLLVFLLKSDRTIKPMVVKPNEGYIFVNGLPHNCSVDFTFLFLGKFPAIVLKEWDIDPVGTKDYYSSLDEGRKAQAYAQIIRMIENSKELSKKKLEGKTLIWIIVLAIVVGYILFAKG